jgi:hypothetical protein
MLAIRRQDILPSRAPMFADPESHGKSRIDQEYDPKHRAIGNDFSLVGGCEIVLFNGVV